MAMRRRMSKKKNRANFKRGALQVKRINTSARPWRGGWRL